MIPIPLRRQDKSIAAYAYVDEIDFGQSLHRWHLSAQGYAARRVIRDGHRRIALLHRELLGLAYGDPLQGDHIDGDRLNCRRANLRAVTPGQNSQNRVGNGGSSAHRGVCWHSAIGRWLAYGQINGRRTYLGLYENEQDAAAAARAWRLANLSHTNEARYV